MSGPRRELERLPHHVYVHTDKRGDVIYVGRTAHPDERPWRDSGARPWIATESRNVEISPPMPFEAARWMERVLIDTVRPRHNQRRGESDERLDWRIDRIAEAEGVTRAAARFAAPYYPTDPDEFEAFLARRVEGVREFEAKVAAGANPDRLAADILNEIMSRAMGGAA